MYTAVVPPPSDDQPAQVYRANSVIDWILHPFLISIYPLLLLYANNADEVEITALLRPLFFCLLGASVVLGIFFLSLRNSQRAALATSLILALFYSYGHIYAYLESTNPLGIALGRHRILFPVWLFILILALVDIIRWRGSYQVITRLLNMITLLLLLFPILQISFHSIQARQYSGNNQNPEHAGAQLQLPSEAPDIYYIILDGYARDDILKQFYSWDNTDFLNQLESMGFFVARCSQSNYAQTQLSLASSLNFDYLDALGDQFKPGNPSRAGLPVLIQDSSVRQELTNLGYQTIAFDSGYDATRIQDADLYLSPNADRGLNDFENMFLRTTAYRLISEGISFLNLPPDWEARDQAHRERILYTLDVLPSIAEMPGKKFVFAHIISPHWPHVFGPNGEAVHEHPNSVDGYRNQVIYINNRILPVISQIIESSDTPPIIIIQGDHGSVIESPKRRMSILNAYYLPLDEEAHLFESISPVNTFRVVFNTYFGGKFPVLDNQANYSVYDRPYDYTVISDERAGCESN